ncbi:8599_t:CDS:2, partial [Diversispora eburnea]
TSDAKALLGLSEFEVLSVICDTGVSLFCGINCVTENVRAELMSIKALLRAVPQ